MSNPETTQQPVQPTPTGPAENGGNGIPAPAGQRTAADYKGRIAPIWCAGCGDYAVLSATQKALANLDVDPDNLAVVSGIGCSSRMPGFVKCYGYHGAHGRALPAAIGLKCGNPRMTVLVVGGDGDGLSIGMGHFPHAVRRNIDMTYLMLDNRIYGLTKGQTSPTSELGMVTRTTPFGSVEPAYNPLAMAVAMDCGFAARGFSGKPRHLADLIKEAVRHPGFSFIQVLQNCVSFNKVNTYKWYRDRVYEVENHDPSDRVAAWRLAQEWGMRIPIGVIYRSSRPSYDSLHPVLRDGAPAGRKFDPAALSRLVERLR
jgi:2-oxoglutarate ferredoxin oxidoreductase subunit beta